jgi:hypothetical protein
MANGGIIGPNIVTSFGGCTVTTKTSSGTFTTQPGTRLAAFAIVAGGGGGGSDRGGGGGAGGVVFNSSFSICGVTTYPLVVGGGGSGGSPWPAARGCSKGTDSTGFGLTAKGGGVGGGSPPGTPLGLRVGSPGGSGGGADRCAPNPPSTGGTGDQPSQPGNSGTFGFGNAGGDSTAASGQDMDQAEVVEQEQ